MKKIVVTLVCAFAIILTGCSKGRQLDAFDGTPHIFIFNEGEITESISPVNSEDGHDLYFEDIDKFNTLMEDNDLLNKKQSKGEVKAITYAQMDEKWKAKEHFVTLISQTGCGHCEAFKENVLEAYTSEHGIVVYELNVRNEDDPKEVYAALQELISE